MIAEFLSLPLASILLLAEINRLWYAAPLIISISLVYAGTRHEAPGEILSHAARFSGWVLVFMAIVMAALQIMWWQEPRPPLPWWWIGVPVGAVILWAVLSGRRGRGSTDSQTTQQG